MQIPQHEAALELLHNHIFFKTRYADMVVLTQPYSNDTDENRRAAIQRVAELRSRNILNDAETKIMLTSYKVLVKT